MSSRFGASAKTAGKLPPIVESFAERPRHAKPGFLIQIFSDSLSLAVYFASQSNYVVLELLFVSLLSGKTMNRFLAAILSFTVAIVAASGCLRAAGPQNAATPKDVQQEIANIENGLGPSIQVQGKPQVSWTIKDRMQHYRVPGVSVAVVKDGQLRWAKGYGIANTKTGQPVTNQTLFQAGSISKPVAALAALKLVDQQKIDLDENVNAYLKRWQVPDNDFTHKEKVTLRRLLTHTAGLTVHGFPGYSQQDKFPNALAVLNGQGNTDPIRVDMIPGTQWRYSGGGYTVMQLLVEDVSGVPFDQYLAEHVLQPIGMKLSTYQQPLPASRQSEASAAYDRAGKIIAGNWHNYPELAAAGLWTTPSDLAAYCIEIQQILAGEKTGILSRQIVQQMLTKGQRDWGLGPSLSGDGEELVFQHGGKNAGFTNEMLAYAHRGQAVIVMTSGDSGGPLCGEILRAIADEYDWRGQTKEVSLFAMDQSQLAAFAGQYAASMNGQTMQVQIAVADNQLKVTIPAQRTTKEIIPIGSTEFVDISDGTQIEFDVNESGTVQGFVVDNRMKFTKSNDR